MLNLGWKSASAHPDHGTTRRGGYRQYDTSSTSSRVISSWCPGYYISVSP